MGDPAGIGPDITLLSWSKCRQRGGPAFFVAGDAGVYLKRAEMLESAGPFPIEQIADPEEATAVFARALPVLPLQANATAAIAGQPDVAHAPAVINSIEVAVSLTAAGLASAVVTNPIAKHILLRHGFPHPGHTEFLGELSARHWNFKPYPVMLMASKRLMAVPVTVHMALKDVPAALTKARLIKVAEVTSKDLSRYYGVERPRLAICGLNPHAGENGELGMEEISVIEPAVKELKSRGILAAGPFSADTLFHDAARETYDVVLAMYHDQALIPFKTLSFEDGVNVTLGLPFIRTSPDHGTAFALAGTGKANPASLIEALFLADRMCKTASTEAPRS